MGQPCVVFLWGVFRVNNFEVLLGPSVGETVIGCLPDCRPVCNVFCERRKILFQRNTKIFSLFWFVSTTAKGGTVFIFF